MGKRTTIIDYSDFPTADDQYTPAERRIIDAEIAKGLADLKAGRFYGPFSTVEEMIASLKRRMKKKAPTNKAARSTSSLAITTSKSISTNG